MLGQTMEEGTITKWLKQEGDKVEKGEPILEVMTDKVNLEVESPASGILRKIIAHADETVPIMALIGIIGEADEPIDDLLAERMVDGSWGMVNGETPEPSPSLPTSPPIPSAASAISHEPLAIPDRVFISPRARRLAHENGISLDMFAGRGTGPNGRVVEKDVEAVIAESRVKASPLAAKVAADQGIDIREVAGSGPRGKVMRDDVLQAATSASFPVMEAKVIPFTGIRKMVADNVAKSAQTAVHVTLTSEVDMTDAVKMRAQVLDEFERKYGTRLTYTDLIVKAVARAILDHPLVNGSLQGNEIRIAADVNIGVALALEVGLIVPVVRNADKKPVAQISSELKALVQKGKSGKLGGDEIHGGTFTISNLGTYGVDMFNPIITPGQSAILGVCRIAEKPMVVGGQVVVRSMMNLCLSFDHRVMDGAPAAQFLARVKELLELPYQLLI